MWYITSQTLRDIIYFNNGPMPVYKLLKACNATTPEKASEVLTLLKLSSMAKTINFNSAENIAWVTEEQFKSCK